MGDPLTSKEMGSIPPGMTPITSGAPPSSSMPDPTSHLASHILAPAASSSTPTTHTGMSVPSRLDVSSAARVAGLIPSPPSTMTQFIETAKQQGRWATDQANAATVLAGKERGAYVFRPNSQNPNMLTIEYLITKGMPARRSVISPSAAYHYLSNRYVIVSTKEEAMAKLPAEPGSYCICASPIVAGHHSLYLLLRNPDGTGLVKDMDQEDCQSDGVHNKVQQARAESEDLYQKYLASTAAITEESLKSKNLWLNSDEEAIERLSSSHAESYAVTRTEPGKLTLFVKRPVDGAIVSHPIKEGVSLQQITRLSNAILTGMLVDTEQAALSRFESSPSLTYLLQQDTNPERMLLWEYNRETQTMTAHHLHHDVTSLNTGGARRNLVVLDCLYPNHYCGEEDPHGNSRWAPGFSLYKPMSWSDPDVEAVLVIPFKEPCFLRRPDTVERMREILREEGLGSNQH